MRILIVCRSFPAHRAGGMESHTQTVVDGLIAAGHRVSVVTTALPRRPAVAPLRVNGSITTVGARVDGRYDGRFVWSLAPAVRAVVAREAIDVVHAQGFAGVVLALAERWTGPLGAPLVTTIHGTHWSETRLDRRTWRRLSWRKRAAAAWQHRARLVTWPLWRAFLATRPRLIVDSEFTRAELRREQPRLRPPDVVPLGFVDREAAAASPDERRAWAAEVFGQRGDDPAPVALALGRLEEIKGFDTVIAAARRLLHDPNSESIAWRLAVAGTGPDESRLRALTRRLGLGDRVVFLGRIDDAAKARALAAAAVVLVPDRGQPAFGLAVAEALAAGTPVIASRVGAHGEVLADPRDGALVAPLRAQDWVEAMDYWLAQAQAPGDSTTRTDRAARAQRQFARRRMVADLVAAYQRARGR